MEVGRAGEIRIGVHRHVDAALVDEREQLVSAAPVDREAEVRMREMQRYLGTSRNCDRIGVCLERVQPVVAMVRTVEAPALANRLEERDDLVVVGGHAERGCTYT